LASNPTPAGPVRESSATRGEVILSGVWKFQPATDKTTEKPSPSDWGTISVPGSWSKNGEGALPVNPVPPAGSAWPGLEGVATAWYERSVDIPVAWSGRALLLQFDRVSTDAKVYVNDQLSGEIRWPSGEVDISKAVKAGQTAVIRVLVVATPDEGDRINFMGYAQESKSKATLMSAGITGDVVLASRPSGSHVTDVFVQPSYRKKSVTLDVSLAGISQAGPLTVTVNMVDEKGTVETTFTQNVEGKVAPEQTLQFTWPWKSPRLWDLGQPNLYTAMVEVKGAGVSDIYPQSFGFREHWIEGKKFILNGTEIRWRPISWHGNSALGEKVIAPLREQGFNISQIWPQNRYARGHADFWGLWAETTDKAGWPIIGVVQNMSQPFIIDAQGKSDNWGKGGREHWIKVMTADLRGMRNHPSIMMWGTTPNISNHASDQNPRYLGQQKLSLDQGATFPEVQEGLKLAKAVDPTRPIFVHAGGRLGDVFTVNHYLNLIPLQEREEWLSDYVKTGDVPYIGVEFGTPLNITMNRGREGFGPSLTSEPWMTEFAAIYFGTDAYRMEPRDYRRNIRFGYKNPKDGWNADWSAMMRIQSQPEPFQKLSALFIRNTWRSWRTAGVTGGMIPWNYLGQNAWNQMTKAEKAAPWQPGQKGPYFAEFAAKDVYFLQEQGGWKMGESAKALIENNQPTLACIVGSPADFTRKDHNFRSGEPLSKQVALINDERTAQPFTAKWFVRVDGKEIASKEESGTLNPAETKLLPLAVTLPSSLTGPKIDGEIVLQAKIGKREHKDAFAFRIHSAVPPPTIPPITVYDPVGKTSTMLKSLGVSFTAWDGKSKTALVVVGREALSSGNPVPPGLEAYVKTGGRVLIMTQRPDWLQNSLGLRIANNLTRICFPISATHPVVAGLDTKDLQNWRGAGTLVDPKPTYDFKTIPSHGWRWGAQGTVSSAAIEKPHFSGWRPILECEFDLAYSPLMELDYGSGRVTLCTLDLEDNIPADPVAERLARQIIAHAATAPLLPRAEKTYYMGGDEGSAFLTLVGLQFEKVSTVPAASSSGLLISGADSGLTVSQAESFAQAGGKVLFLAQPKVDPATPVPLKLTTNFYGAQNLPVHPAAAGLSLSDLRIRSELDWRVIDAAKTPGTEADGLLAFKAAGRGLLAFTQINPTALDANKNIFYRFSRWRQTRALTQLMANLGGTFNADGNILNPRTVRVDISGPWKFRIIKPLPNHDWSDPHPDPGASAEALAAVKLGADDSTWNEVNLPSWIPDLEKQNGEYVARKMVTVPPEWAGQTILLAPGRIKSFDTTFWNGKKVGATGAETKDSWNLPRRYRVLGTEVKPGQALISIRGFATDFQGGIHGSQLDMFLSLIAKEKIPPFYSSDYKEDQSFGDNPYRYYRW